TRSLASTRWPPARSTLTILPRRPAAGSQIWRGHCSSGSTRSNACTATSGVSYRSSLRSRSGWRCTWQLWSSIGARSGHSGKVVIEHGEHRVRCLPAINHVVNQLQIICRAVDGTNKNLSPGQKSARRDPAIGAQGRDDVTEHGLDRVARVGPVEPQQLLVIQLIDQLAFGRHLLASKTNKRRSRRGAARVLLNRGARLSWPRAWLRLRPRGARAPWQSWPRR